MNQWIATNSSQIPEPLYRQIKQIMPIVCVDLLILDTKKHILLIRRKNEPARGKWWFPGGRVFFGETRIEAAVRKLRDECGLESGCFKELFTEDCFLHSPEGLSHGVTTFYKTSVQDKSVKLDDQSTDHAWKTLKHWMDLLAKEEVGYFFTRISDCFDKIDV